MSILTNYQLQVRNGFLVKPGTDKLVHAALGLTGESGEVADQIKKSQYTGRVLDTQEIPQELGDVLWYLTALADMMGFSIEEIALLNLKKLSVRYPNTYRIPGAPDPAQLQLACVDCGRITESGE